MHKYVNTVEQWENIHRFLLLCGQSADPDELAIQIIDHIGMLCSFDAASAYLIDANGKMVRQHLRNIDEKWIKIYLAYYMNTDDHRYSFNRHYRNSGHAPYLQCHDWSKEKSVEFVPDFIRIRGLTYSCGFGLYDLNQRLRMSIALDRKGTINFSEEELERIRLALPVLNGYHRNFYYVPSSTWNTKKHEDVTALTIRESQIAALLCQSASPLEISQTLHIAQSTTYKHIANIYRKLNVSSQRELLSLLLNGAQE